jgi:uncharacterized protein involved in copper resistance
MPGMPMPGMSMPGMPQNAASPMPGMPQNAASPMPGMPGMPGMSTTSTMSGGRRGKRSTRRKQGGGQMSTQSVPMMKGGRRSRKQRGGQSTQSVPMMKGGAMPAVGSKAQVWHGSARHTSGGLTKKDLMKHKGRIISKRKHALGKKALKNLVKAGYKAKKGTFKLFKK